MRRRTIVIFGASLGGRRAFQSLGWGDKVMAFCDNDASKHGTLFMGRPVVAPVSLNGLGADRILIASSHAGEIYPQLLALGIDSARIDVLDNSILNGANDALGSGRRWVVVILGLLLVATGILALAAYGLYRLVVDHLVSGTAP